MSLNPKDVMDAIVDEQYHLFPNTTMTVCCLTLCTSKGKVHAVGYGDCMDPRDFDEQVGRESAKAKAVASAFDIIATHLKLGGSF